MQVIDVHGHIGHWTFPTHCASVHHLQDYMERCQIAGTVVSHSLAITYDFVEGNARLAEAIQDAKGVWGYITLNPHYLAGSLAELDRYKEHPQFVGVKLHPEQQAYRLTDGNVLVLLEEVSELDLPVLVHTFPGQTHDLCQVALQFPQIKFIMGHMGGDDWAHGIAAAAARENIWLEPCSSFPAVGKVNRAVEALGSERVLFGSDSNLLHPAFVWGMLEDAGLSPEEMENIAYRNAQGLFRLR